ncbi:hypothetical protein PanWU01x14_243720, partial [Parasponia andersonii]
DGKYKCTGKPILQLLEAFFTFVHQDTKALNRYRGRCLSRRLIDALIDLSWYLISAFVAKAYHSTWNQGAFVGTVKGLSRYL